MALDNEDALAMVALSILHDPRPHPHQPILDDGVHLRWFPGANRGFPLKGGYFCFAAGVGGLSA